MDQEQLLDAHDLARLLKVKPVRVYELAREGGIPSVRLGRSVRFHPRAIAQWLDAGGTSAERGPELARGDVG